MSKKRFSQRNSRRKGGNDRQRPQKRHLSHMLEQGILAYLHQADSPASMTDIARSTSGKRTLSNELKTCFAHLLQKKVIQKQDKKSYALHPAAPLYVGELQQHPRGFGFAVRIKSYLKAPPLERDIHIPANALGKAVHGDRVLVYLRDAKSSNRPEGTIIAVLERGPDTITGFLAHERRRTVIHPEDIRYPFIIEVDQESCSDIENGTVVIARVQPPDGGSRVVRGSITEILGSPDNIDVQMRLVIEKFRLPHKFSQACLDEAAQLQDIYDKSADRKDLRKVNHVTIDGETAKDFDDAICVTRTDNGFQLHVSIADVSHFVKPGSPIDKDAYQRGTSIYFPGRVIPMLPENLSNNLCSLIPNEERLAVTAILDFDSTGKRTGVKYCRSIIQSKQRFTYTTVANILIEQDPSERDKFSQFLPMLEAANELARLLLHKREERGSVNFSLPEPEISLDNDGKISTIRRAERNFAHQIIEEFMLAANEAVAETFTRKKRSALYRIHELPDLEKVTEFSEFAKTLDLGLPAPEISPEWFGKVLAACEDSSKEYIVNNLLLRTMQQARYAPENVGHFALAAEDYTHFTSPIRRYPDLTVHRELCRIINEENKRGVKVKSSRDLAEQGEFLSGRERAAINAEREMNDRLKVLYMEKHLEEEYRAIISGVTDFALFIELLDLFISGTIPLEQLGDDYFLFDSKHHRVIGEISGVTYQIGDILQVKATEVDRSRNRIIFHPSSGI